MQPISDIAKLNYGKVLYCPLRKVKVKSLSQVRLCDPGTVAY